MSYEEFLSELDYIDYLYDTGQIGWYEYDTMYNIIENEYYDL